MRIQLPIFYNQMDLRWATILLGFNSALPYNIYNFGCLITCLAMILKYYGKDETPATINEKLKGVEGFPPGSGDYKWGFITKIFNDVSEKLVNTPDLLTDAQIAEIKTAIDNGFPVMIQLDYNPKTVANETHYVVVTAYNPQDENDFTIADPLTGNEHSLKDYLGWFRPNARKTISQYIIYSGTIQHATNTTCLLPNTPDNQQVYKDIVHGSTEWDKTVVAYIPGNDSKQTKFEDVQKVIAAFKGQASNAQGQVQQLSSELAVANVEIKNREEQVSRLQDQVSEIQKTQKIEIDALKATMPDLTKLKAQYDGNLAARQLEVDQAKIEVGTLRKQLAALQAGQKQNNWVVDILLLVINKIKFK